MYRESILTSITISLILLTILPLYAQDTNSANTSLALTNVTLIDGTGASARSSMTVVIKGNKIDAIFHSDEQLIPTSTEILNLNGQFLIPGMINSHIHLPMLGWNIDSASKNLIRMFYAGVTSIREPAGDARLAAGLDRIRLMDKAPFPSIYWAARIAGTSFYESGAGSRSWIGYESGTAPWAQAVTAESDMKRVIALAAGSGASGLKLYTDLEPEVVRLLIDEAQRKGMKTWAHGTIFPTGPLEAVRSGINTLSHTCLLPFGLTQDIPSQRSELKPLDPNSFNLQDTSFPELLIEMKDRDVVMDATALNASQGPASNRLKCTPEIQKRMLLAIHESGIPISAGTDYFLSEGEPDPTLFTEIEYLVEINVFSPLEAITAATLNGARAIGIEALYGSIVPGKIADIVILSDDPTTEISALQSVFAIIKEGRVYYRSEYNEE